MIGVELHPPLIERASFGRSRSVHGDGCWDSGLSTRAIATTVTKCPRVPRQDGGNCLGYHTFLLYDRNFNAVVISLLLLCLIQQSKIIPPEMLLRILIPPVYPDRHHEQASSPQIINPLPSDRIHQKKTLSLATLC
ncbi:hypothetical protein AVEN_97190-1 [Araneus ventricosus]|uniref:Uncharacterized protein n=1 Tax=Araneus ventricosus TaxID=182803 RepID=A0A4Y2DD07_ARAVE|nr:hypothetical protein AVEN_97190-1 [Araneus ventricosus]